MVHPAPIRSPIRLVAIAIAIATFTLGACAGSSTTIEQSWTAPNARNAPFRKVVSLFLSRDGAMRRAAEDKMARELAARGVQATPAYQVLPTTM